MRHKHRVKSRKLKVKSLLVATLLTFAFSLSTVSAQESINATGGDASGSGGSVSYSVGQIAYQTQTGTNGSVVQGVQQPYEIYTVTAIEEAEGINLLVSAYPNPTTDYLTLEIEGDVQTQYLVSLYDMQGKLLQNKKITSNQTTIFMGNLVPSTYFVKVIQGSQSVKEFKIIKTQ
jgi:hypothetical protein